MRFMASNDETLDFAHEFDSESIDDALQYVFSRPDLFSTGEEPFLCLRRDSAVLRVLTSDGWYIAGTVDFNSGTFWTSNLVDRFRHLIIA